MLVFATISADVHI